MSDSQETQLGRVRMESDGDPTAGSFGTWQVTYTAGTRCVAPAGRIRITTDADADCGTPQVDDPSEAEYTTVHGPRGVAPALHVHDHKLFDVVVAGRALAPGEQITVVFGDRSGGGPGARWQTFIESRHHIWVQIDADGNGHFETLVESPEFNVRGGDIARLVVVAPSNAVTEEPFRVMVKAEDEWGNPAHAYRGWVQISATGLALPEVELQFSEEHEGVRWIDDCVATEEGINRIEAHALDRDIVGRSNPVVCTQDAPSLRLLWGDPHGGQVADARKIVDFFSYARDVAGISFAGYQRNDPVMTNLDYQIQQQAEVDFYEPGRFVPLPGYEWSAPTSRGGHHNLYFRRYRRPARRSGHTLGGHQDMPAVPGIPTQFDPIDDELPHVLDLYRAYRGADLILTPHVGGAHADLSYHEPTLEPAIEITSGHGTFEWFQREALEHNYRVGFVGGSDCHTGRPGTDHPGHQERRFAKGGLTGLYCTELTIDGWIAAMRARRCFATTGARIVAAISADGHFMGGEFSTDQGPEISVSINGTAPLEKVDLYRGTELIYSHDFRLSQAPDRLRVLWTGASRMSSYSGVVWNGGINVSGARVEGVEKLRFDSPRSNVFDVTVHGMRWHSLACGYPSGVIVNLDSSDATVDLSLSSASLSRAQFGGHGESAPVQNASQAPAERLHVSFDVADLRTESRNIDIGVLDRSLAISLAPEGGPESVDFKFVDRAPEPGWNAYWVRVQQQDMELAWTSPVFVDFVPRR